MWTLVIATSLGTVSLPFDSLEACQSGGFNLLYHEAQRDGAVAETFYCIERATGEVWASVTAD